MQRVNAGEIPAPQQRGRYELNTKTPFFVGEMGFCSY
jgi:hypothetical protein